MKAFDEDGRRLCQAQGEIFEASVSKLKMSSEMFVRRFMNSKLAKDFDSSSFLDGGYSIQNVFESFEEQYGHSASGSKKYDRNLMYWVGYVYRYLCYSYQLSSKQAYKILSLTYIASSYDAYHSLDVSLAIDRLLESKGVSFEENSRVLAGVSILKSIKERKGGQRLKNRKAT